MNFRRFNKYICAACLAAVMSVTTMGATTITDVTSSHWAYSAITDLEERGIMVLTSSGQFYPNQTMNYFEVADVIAKATGYVDVDIATNVTQEFKEQIKNNYEKQKSTLASYAAKYSSWNSAYNQQIAYLLGRGYMSTSDLDKFITKTANGETKNIITKEQLAVYIVRMLGKEKTATTTYTTTTFTDDSTLSATTKPYLAYLKSVGLVTADASGKVNGTMKVTKALCAKLVSDALKINDTTKVGLITSNDSTSTGTTSSETNALETYKIGKVLTKNTTEYYILLETATGEQHWHSFKNTSKITDETGAEVPITKLVAGTTVKAAIGLEGNTEYITSIQITNEAGTTTDTNTNTNTNDQVVGTVTTAQGTLVNRISNGVLRIALPDGTTKAYIIADNCVTVLNGVVELTTDNLNAGDAITLTLQNSAVTKITATSAAGNTDSSSSIASTISGGSVASKKFAGKSYVLTVKQGSVTESVSVPTTATVKRNNKTVELSEIRIGDTVEFTRSNGVVTGVTATGKKTTVEGVIKEIHIASTSQLVVTVNNEEMVYTLASNVEVYDNNVNDYVNVRDLHLGQEVTIVLESMEAVSIDVDKTSTTYNLMGTITNVGKNYAYIDVLVDYDYVTGESKVYKRIETPSDLPITLNGKTKYRSALEEDMDVVINYKYLDDTVPEKILIIQ